MSILFCSPKKFYLNVKIFVEVLKISKFLVKMLDIGDGEDYDFTPSETSKLSSLFGALTAELKPPSDLTYTAPKQPTPSLPHFDKENDKQVNSHVSLQRPSLPSFDRKDSDKPGDLKVVKKETEVLMVKVVFLWKLEDKTYKSLGKHGLGIIGSRDSKVQDIIAYKSKNNVILRARLTEKFLFFLQKDKFSSFYDNESQNWLAKFENDDQNEFTEKIKSFGGKIIDSTDSTSIMTKTSESDKGTRDLVKPDLLPKPENLTTGDESDSSQKRANILNRITKLGQQIVPKPLSTGSDASDLEGEIQKNRKHRKPKKTYVEKAKEKEVYQQPQQIPIEGAQPITKPLFNEYPVSNVMTIPPLAHHFPMYYAPQPDISNYLLSQNNELKQALTTISSKLDNLNFPKVCNENSTLISKLKAVELKADNLKAIAENYKKKYTDLEAKYLELLDKDQDKSVESNILVADLELQITALKSQVEEAEVELTELRKQNELLEKAKRTLKEYEAMIENQKVRLMELETFYEENKEVVKKNDAVNTLNSVVEGLNERLKAYEEKFSKAELERLHTRQKNEKKVKNIGDLIKIYMNEMYQKILSNYNEEYNYTYNEIKTSLMDNMKSTTFKMIEEITERIIDEPESAEL